MILVDSSVWVDYFRGVTNGPTNTLDRLLGSESLAIGDLILTEVLQGFKDARAFTQARKVLTTLTVVDIAGEQIAIQAALNFRILRDRGVTVRKTIATLIATRCIVDRYDLLHNDKDFEPFVQYLGLRSVI